MSPKAQAFIGFYIASVGAIGAMTALFAIDWRRPTAGKCILGVGMLWPVPLLAIGHWLDITDFEWDQAKEADARAASLRETERRLPSQQQRRP